MIELLSSSRKKSCTGQVFYNGVLIVDNMAAMSVAQAKPEICDQFITLRQARVYSDTERKVTSQIRDECEVVLCDQRYLKSGEPSRRNKVEHGL